MSAESLLDHFAVLKGITERRARKEVVEALLRQTNLWDVRKQKLGGYSGGMRQRFGVAVALLGNPKLMIVDEPTAGLDPAERVRFLNLLSELGENSVVLLSTHIVEDVKELCTRMAIIDRGEILLEAEPLRAVEELRGRIWRRVMSKDELPSWSGARGDLDEAARGADHRARLQRASPGAGFEPVEPDLEDVYFSTMAGHIGRRREQAASEGGHEVPGDLPLRVRLPGTPRPTWLYFAALVVVAFSIQRKLLADARRRCLLNSPFVIAQSRVFWRPVLVLMAAAVAGKAAARDVETRMHPLIYTAPVSKAEYLGGRFLAAFVLNALILLAVPVGILLAVYLPGVDAEVLGPFRPAAYLSGLRFSRVAERLRRTAIQFSWAALNRRAIASYIGSVLFFFVASVASSAVLINVVRKRTWRRCWMRSATRHPSGSMLDMDTDREEYAPDRTGGLAAREPPPMGRHRSGDTRIHLLPLSLRPSPALGSACDDGCGPTPPNRIARARSTAGSAASASRRTRADACHRVDIVPDDREECGRARSSGRRRDARGHWSCPRTGEPGSSAAPQNRVYPQPF